MNFLEKSNIILIILILILILILSYIINKKKEHYKKDPFKFLKDVKKGFNDLGDGFKKVGDGVADFGGLLKETGETSVDAMARGVGVKKKTGSVDDYFPGRKKTTENNVEKNVEKNVENNVENNVDNNVDKSKTNGYYCDWQY